MLVRGLTLAGVRRAALGRLNRIMRRGADWRAIPIKNAAPDKPPAANALMTAIGTRGVSAIRNITRPVAARMSKAKAHHAAANIKNVAKSAAAMITPPAISLPDMSKAAVAPAAAAQSIRLNAILTPAIRGLMLTAALRAEPAAPAPMIPELIIKNAPARICMNGAPVAKNASAQRGINTPARGRTTPAVKALLAITNTKNANAKPDSPGAPPAACAPAPAPIGAP